MYIEEQAPIVITVDIEYGFMAHKHHPKTEQNQPVIYQIRIKGHLSSQWNDWFGGMTIVLEENGETLLTGPVVDQAALHGLIKKVRDLGIPLVSVNCLETEEGNVLSGKRRT